MSVGNYLILSFQIIYVFCPTPFGCILSDSPDELAPTRRGERDESSEDTNAWNWTLKAIANL